MVSSSACDRCSAKSPRFPYDQSVRRPERIFRRTESGSWLEATAISLANANKCSDSELSLATANKIQRMRKRTANRIQRQRILKFSDSELSLSLATMKGVWKTRIANSSEQRTANIPEQRIANSAKNDVEVVNSQDLGEPTLRDRRRLYSQQGRENPKVNNGGQHKLFLISSFNKFCNRSNTRRRRKS